MSSARHIGVSTAIACQRCRHWAVESPRNGGRTEMGFSGVPIIDMILPERGTSRPLMRPFRPRSEVDCYLRRVLSCRGRGCCWLWSCWPRSAGCAASAEAGGGVRIGVGIGFPAYYPPAPLLRAVSVSRLRGAAAGVLLSGLLLSAACAGLLSGPGLCATCAGLCTAAGIRAACAGRIRNLRRRIRSLRRTYAPPAYAPPRHRATRPPPHPARRTACPVAPAEAGHGP